jgi:phospholipase C
MSTLPRRARIALAAALAASAAGAVPAQATPVKLPTPDHVVVVVFENHSYDQVIGNPDAPYLNDTLAAGGATLTDSHGVTHPSQPNYYALFSGATQGISDDNCPPVQGFSAPNLASELLADGQSWLSYNEDLPAEGSTVCTDGLYARKHNPWFGFDNVPLDTAKTFAQFPTDYNELPKESFVIPNLCDDMHNEREGCTVGVGDSWLHRSLGGYAKWAKSHNSLLVVTFDEDDYAGPANRIPTLVYGQHVIPGSTAGTYYDHFNVLRTLEDLARLSSHAGEAASVADVTGIWK